MEKVSNRLLTCLHIKQVASSFPSNQENIVNLRVLGHLHLQGDFRSFSTS